MTKLWSPFEVEIGFQHFQSSIQKSILQNKRQSSKLSLWNPESFHSSLKKKTIRGNVTLPTQTFFYFVLIFNISDRSWSKFTWMEHEPDFMFYHLCELWRPCMIIFSISLWFWVDDQEVFEWFQVKLEKFLREFTCIGRSHNFVKSSIANHATLDRVDAFATILKEN